MIHRIKAHVWLLGVTVLPAVLVFAASHPLGRRWS